MKYIRLYDTEDEFVEDLFSNNVTMPRLVVTADTKKSFYGRVKDFIMVDPSEEAYLGFDENTIALFETF